MCVLVLVSVNGSYVACVPRWRDCCCGCVTVAVSLDECTSLFAALMMMGRGSGIVDADTVCAIPELACCPVARRVVVQVARERRHFLRAAAADGNVQLPDDQHFVDYEGFATAMMLLSQRCPAHLKCRGKSACVTPTTSISSPTSSLPF
jgi:hypothetical protein